MSAISGSDRRRRPLEVLGSALLSFERNDGGINVIEQDMLH